MSGKKKITLTVSDELYNQLEEYSKLMGVTKNSICTMWVAQNIMTLNKTFDSVTKSLFEGLTNLANTNDEGNNYERK